MNESSLYRNAKKILDKTPQLFLLLIVAASVIVSFPIATGKPSSSSYNYKFTVNEDGFTWVDITFQSTEGAGSSWVFVPKFSPWRNITLLGKIETLDLVDTKDIPEVGEDYYFYQALKFDFASTNSFQLKIHFNMTEGALTIEPRGIFFSPQIGFDPESTGKAEVIFPSDFSVQKVAPSGRIVENRVSFDSIDYLVRLQIEFETAATEPTWKQLNQSVFSFQTVNRYENYASEILTLFNAVYDDFTDLFNVTLENIDVQFFIPDFETLLSIGGYVPFTGQTMGEININIFFIRAVNGTIQAIALHELIHHFLWKAGLSPDFFLWFHEGAAQLVSIETVYDLGYEGAVMERDRLEQGASQLISLQGENFGFLQEWAPDDQPVDVTRNYVASYYVVSRLAEEYGGLDFYERFFKLIRGLKIETNDELAFHLSFAANASVDLKLKLWGFDIHLLYTGSKIDELIYEAEKAIDGLSPVFQPYSLVAKFLYHQALLRLERGDYEGANQLLNAAITLANLAPLLTLLTLVAIFAIIAYILLKRMSEPSLELPPLPPTFEETNA